MCLKPIKILNPSKRQYLSGSSRLRMSVPCGDCVECAKRKQLDWSCRAYYEALDTFKSGGFVYFDTLTYDDEHLPHVSDFLSIIPNNCVELLSKYNYSCFDRSAPKRFFANLRERLKRYGLDVVNKLSFLLTSEYGEDDNRTHRPHYHVLFFVKQPLLSPYDFSLFVHDAWFAGRTDGCPYQSLSYVDNHIFTSQSLSDQTHMLNIINYVSKYVSKDSIFKFEVEHRINLLLSFFDDTSDEYDEYRRQVIRAIKPFNRASVGFGSSFLHYNDLSEIERTGKVKMPDPKKSVVYIPLPMYFKRKLWYELVTDVEGTLRWQLNDAGKSHNRCYASVMLNSVRQNFDDWFSNLSVYLPDNKSLIDKILARHINIDDFAEYIYFYRGRLLSDINIRAIQCGLKVDIPTVDEIITNELYPSGDFKWSYLNKRAKKHFGFRFLSNSYCGCTSFSFSKSLDKSTGEYLSYELPSNPVIVDGDYLREYTYNDKMSPKWRHFDWVYEIYLKSLHELSKKHDKSVLDTRIYNERMRYIYKPLKLTAYV